MSRPIRGQSANETEVYGVATFTIALMAWLALRWRALRGTQRASRLLLLAVYLGGVSMGNHLLALLAGPALVVYLVTVLRDAPAADPAQARREWGEVAVVAGIWSLLIGTGLGSATLVALGAVLFVLAASLAWRWGAGQFAILSWVLASIGVTVYLFLYIRAGHRPMINEADPSTWEALLAVIRREQYPPRTPFDDQTVLSGRHRRATARAPRTPVPGSRRPSLRRPRPRSKAIRQSAGPAKGRPAWSPCAARGLALAPASAQPACQADRSRS